MSEPLAVRLAARTEIAADGCWLWTGYVRADGYGVLTQRRDGRPFPEYAHRLSYETHVGQIPDGLQLDHLCRVRHCVNPAHLEPVSLGTNVLRGSGVTAVNAGKTACAHGHEFTPENTVRRPGGGRTCRACERAKSARRNMARKAAS